jgi:nucleotide-binding universal stress UspA family protein
LIRRPRSTGLRLLVAIDFSRESRAALRAARDLVKRAGGNVTIAHVRPLSDVRAAVREERGDLLTAGPPNLSRGIADHFRTLLGKTVGPNEHSRLLRGDPARELRREATRGYDYLVMGTHGRGRGGTFLLGSTVQKVLVRTPIPIIVVPAGRR